MKSKTTCLLGLVVSINVSAQSTQPFTHRSASPSSGEQKAGALTFSKALQRIDLERSETLWEWEKRYVYDKAMREGKPYVEPPYYEYDNLQASRKLDLSGVDRCFAEPGETSLTFAQVMERQIKRVMLNHHVYTDSVIDSSYQLIPMENRDRIGLLSHPFCEVDLEQRIFEKSFHPKSRPDYEMGLQLRAYFKRYNEMRNKVLTAISSKSAAERAINDFTVFQGVFMSCLGYSESLSGPDSLAGDEQYNKLLAKGYVPKGGRPAAVSLGYDRGAYYLYGNKERREQISYGLDERETFFAENGKERFRHLKLPAKYEGSKIKFIQKRVKELQAARSDPKRSVTDVDNEFFTVIPDDKWVAAGIYQFKIGDFDTPKGDLPASNIGACIRQWNAMGEDDDKKKCSIKIKHNVAGHARALTSPGQTFNIFCGVQKIMQSLSVQVYTQNPDFTAPQNLMPDGITLKAPKDRCVHPFWRGGLAYNHFGPLAGSAPRGSIASKPAFPGNLSLMVECLKNNDQTLFSSDWSLR